MRTLNIKYDDGCVCTISQLNLMENSSLKLYECRVIVINSHCSSSDEKLAGGGERKMEREEQAAIKSMQQTN